MTLPHDLKNYKAPAEDAFSLITPDMAIFALCILIAICALAGCASMDYEWRHARPAAAKPWFYITVQDVDTTCRLYGAQARRDDRINGCAQWREGSCIIILPQNAPVWLIAHEEKHCAGFDH